MSIVTLIAIITFLIACNTSSSFVSDDEFLDFIQKSHFNYMWEGAEPISGLALERIHIDGVYPDRKSTRLNSSH